MGLAVLPSRLAEELNAVKDMLLGRFIDSWSD